jgi:hypothetical protein
MKAQREEILGGLETQRQKWIERRFPDDFDELPENEQADFLAKLEDEFVSVDRAVLPEEIARLSALIAKAKRLEAKGEASPPSSVACWPSTRSSTTAGRSCWSQRNTSTHSTTWQVGASKTAL